MTMQSPNDWSKIQQEFQQKLTQSWGQALQAFQTMDLGGIVPADGQAALPVSPKLKFEQDKLKQLQAQYLEEAAALWNGGLQGGSPLKDRRFSSEAWAQNPVASFTAGSYLLNARTLMGLAEAVDADAQTQNRIRFAVEQWVAATAPSNFLAFNAEAQKKAIETQGESLAKGMQNLMHDMQQGHVSMTDESLFEVGKNVATTEGAVVFENEFFQLIEYKPLTAKVYEKPFLLIPPCINKFYILDLQPTNSFIRYAVGQGHRTFVVSWRNPDESMAKKSWDDYIEEGALQAIATVQDLTGAKQINALGFCVGGTILSNALAVLAARGEKPVASATFLTTLIDFTDTGILDVFIDENFVKFRELQMGQGGLLKGQDLASTFSFLRPNDLVWNYVVGNYLKGESPPHSTCSTGTATPPTCRALFTLGTCATLTSKTGWSNRTPPRCAAKNRSAQSQFTGLHLWLARRPHRAHRWRLRLHPAPAWKKAFCDGRIGSHRGRDQRPGGQQAKPLAARRRQVSSRCERLDPRRQRAARQLVDRLVRLAQEPRWQANCCTQNLRQRRSFQDH